MIGGVAEKHLGMMGYTQRLRDLYERAAPEMAAVIERSRAEGVVLTAGCPLCHRTVVAIQREIEMRGIPTVLITLVPRASREMGPPRAIAPGGFTLGDRWACPTSWTCSTSAPRRAAPLGGTRGAGDNLGDRVPGVSARPGNPPWGRNHRRRDVGRGEKPQRAQRTQRETERNGEDGEERDLTAESAEDAEKRGDAEIATERQRIGNRGDGGALLA